MNFNDASIQLPSLADLLNSSSSDSKSTQLPSLVELLGSPSSSLPSSFIQENLDSNKCKISAGEQHKQPSLSELLGGGDNNDRNSGKQYNVTTTVGLPSLADLLNASDQAGETKSNFLPILNHPQSSAINNFSLKETLNLQEGLTDFQNLSLKELADQHFNENESEKIMMSREDSIEYHLQPHSTISIGIILESSSNKRKPSNFARILEQNMNERSTCILKRQTDQLLYNNKVDNSTIILTAQMMGVSHGNAFYDFSDPSPDDVVLAKQNMPYERKN